MDWPGRIRFCKNPLDPRTSRLRQNSLDCKNNGEAGTGEIRRLLYLLFQRPIEKAAATNSSIMGRTASGVERCGIRDGQGGICH